MKRNLLSIKLAAAGICSVLSLGAIAQISFTNKNTLLHSNTGVLGSNGSARSGNSMAILDMNNDGLDDICKLQDNGEIRIEYQNPGGSFTYQYIGTMNAAGAWAMCAGDVDKNGYKDVITGYGSSLKLMKIGANGSMGVTTLPNSGFFVQNMNFMDVNNDGWLDIFACDDNAYSKLYLNNGSGSFPAEAGNSVINFDVTPGQTIGSSNDDSGNYGSVWTDFDNDGDVDLFIAHCRQSVNSGTDARRINKLFVNNGNNVFTEQAAAYGLASGDQDWTSSFGDINNDGDFDLFLTKHNTTSRIYDNNGSNQFIAGATVAFGSMPMQSVFEDLDNDGYVDIIVSGDNDHRIYRNNGSGVFTDVTPAYFTVSNSNMLSFAIGDLNHDGKIDIYSSYGGTYNNPSNNQDDVYWQNNTNNTNHFITIIPVATISNKDALGVMAKIYGSWGVQSREVRAGESYGTINTGYLHFGLGQSTTIDSLVVTWPSGIRTVIINPAIDNFLNINESTPCALTSASITPSGPTDLCNGQSVTLSANAGTGYTYLWSNGATTESIVVTTPGSYAVTVSESAFCNATSGSVTVTFNANETPTISAAGDTTICEGAAVTLTSSAATAYLWSNGETTQSIQANQAGSYTCTIQGRCQQWTSNTIGVNVLAAPAPTSSDVTIVAPASVNLTATGGDSLRWYDSSTGGTLLASGPSYTTPVVSATTTYYVDATTYYGNFNGNVGLKYNNGATLANQYSGGTTNATLSFTVNTSCTLKKVKVYTDTPGNRLIELRSSTGAVLQSMMVNIPIDTSFITLNFALAPGNYLIGTNTAQNQTLLGTASPRLRRSNTGVVYPYTIGNYVSITGSSQGGTLYYYFYDWEIEAQGSGCTSVRTPVTVFMSPTGISSASQSKSISIAPNPANEYIQVNINTGNVDKMIEVKDMSGRIVFKKWLDKSTITTSINVSEFAEGAYILNVISEKENHIQKFMVTK